MNSLLDAVKVCTEGETPPSRLYGVILWKNPVKSHTVFTHQRQQREPCTRVMFGSSKANPSEAETFNILVYL